MQFKSTLLLFSMLAIGTNALCQQNINQWSIGLRTGSFNETFTYKKKTTVSGDLRNIRNGLFHQGFINRALGRKKQWLLEANIGYNSYSYENQKLEWVNAVEYYNYTFSKTHVLSFQLNVRYAFLRFENLNWTHYAGATFALHSYLFRGNTFGNNEDPNVYVYRSYKENAWQNFIGLEYFSSINLTRKFNIQYLIGYSISSDQFAPRGSYSLSDEPTTQRLNINFGFGFKI